ncbi:MAG TPA: hypothetical protein P5268_03410 [Candidatus Marinimicrobia bacterium]|nr:hypothetical protein [Candidatus Neomarinimicrobiota bacterium]HRS52329.1 hypothetical protein [Candidatus Neomarinimicrobiota bacterium]HRU92067.1 hypothetical protein [Candidatus Neomarinimicrobiota bacterium]
MIKINLATKPGLQEEPKNITVNDNLKDILIRMSATPKEQPVGDRIIDESETKPVPEASKEEVSTFALEESNLEMTGQAKTEEPIPQTVSGISDKLREAEKIVERKEKEYSKHSSKRIILNIGIWILVLVIIGTAGYWAYYKYFKTQTSSITVESKNENILPTEKPAPVVEETQPSSSSEVAEVVPPKASQIDETYLPRIFAGIARCQVLSQLVGTLPGNSRIQFLKLDKDKINFLIFIDSENNAQQAKTKMQNLPGIVSTQAFYIEHTANIPAPAVQMMAILNLRTENAPSRNIRFYDDVSLSQVLWATGKKHNLKLQPISIAEPPAPKPRLAEIRGSGNLADIINLISELSSFDLNLSIEKISLDLSSESTLDTGILNFNISSVIYPQKL